MRNASKRASGSASSSASNKGNQRIARINDEIAKIASQIIRFEMSDPRIGTVVSVTDAKTTNDLKYCKIFVSILDDEKAKETLSALSNAAGFVRKRIADTLNLRHTPEITFIQDDSIAHAMRMHQLIDEVVKNDP